jgi:hypothetical protein
MQCTGSLQEKSSPDARFYGLEFQGVREKRLCSSPGGMWPLVGIRIPIILVPLYVASHRQL